MFWRFGGYATISAIDSLLDKGDVPLEELLDESDLIQELKQHNTKLIEYLREETVLQRLLEYVAAPKLAPVASEPSDAEAHDSPPGKDRSRSRGRSDGGDHESDGDKKRNRYAYVAAEILASDNWSICETLMEEQRLLRKFWDFVQLPAPLDPLQASYFTKVNESLFDKKTEEMLELFKSLDGVVKNMLQHVDSPMIMDLLLKIVSLEKAEGGQGILEWLYTQDLMPILLSFLSPEHSWSTQTSAGDFLKAIITISANASQNEASCIGPNELTRQLVSQPCVEKLVADMLKGGNPLTVGVGIVIEVIRKNNSDYDPEVGDVNAPPSSRDPIYLGTLLRLFAQHVPDFMKLILSPNHTVGSGDGPVSVRRQELGVASGGKIEPLGFDRFKTCELMAELLHCSNMGLLNELGSEEYIKARDAEREHLRREGRLSTSLDHVEANATEEDLTMKSSNTRLGSPDTSRKLEVQNASDDDFEEVTHANDLGEESKDELVEKPDMEGDLPSRASDMPLHFLDKDDDFVDEPLSSPRLHPDKTPMDEPDMMVQPLSPSKELSQQVGSLGFKEEDTPMTSPPPSIDTVTEDSEASTNDSSHDSSGTSDASTDSPPRKQPDQHEESPIPDGSGQTDESTITAEIPAVVASAASLETSGQELPHLEDQPAPLSVSKAEASIISEAHDASQTPPGRGESADTTMGEAGDSSHSVMMGDVDAPHHAQAQEPSITPVVGDYLKMQFVDHQVVPTILDFFFRFPWNNFLHNVVYDVVQQVFNGPMDRGFNRSLAIDLFETGDITTRIVDGQRSSDESQKRSKMRLGYMGHLTLIAEEVVKFTERHPPELLSEFVLEKVMKGEWVTYVEGTLAETRERDNAILGGVRPDMVGGPRQSTMSAVNAPSNFGTSSALADAGLNGPIALESIDLANGNGARSNNYALGGTLLSGFGSSSDEEDDEMEEDNEEGGFNTYNAPEFSRYISDPSTTTSTSMASADLAPPSIPPPPPPPLNIPPSRARRQLAARLALHKQNAVKNSDEKDFSVDGRINVNPFTSAEEDDDDQDEDFTIGDIEGEDDGKGHVGGNSFDLGFGYGGVPGQKSSNSSDEEIHSGDEDDEDEDEGEGEVLDYGDRPSHTHHISALTDHDGERVRRLSVTREAKRRTSLEDDDEEDVMDEEEEDGVVHVGWGIDIGDASVKERNQMSHPIPSTSLASRPAEGTEDDGELVEVQPGDMQGLDEGHSGSAQRRKGVEERGGVETEEELAPTKAETEVEIEPKGQLPLSEK